MLTIKVNDKAFGQPLRELADALGDPAPVLDAIGHLLETEARGRAERGVDPSGARWATWSDATREGYPWPGAETKERIEHGPGNGRLLDRYGDMLGRLSYQVTGDRVRVGFAHDYATYHEYGTKHMRRRGLLTADPDTGTLGAEDEASVLDLITGWLDELLQ
jgi:phage gpG-like protein